MTCVELQESLAEFETGSSAEQLAHLKNCPECSALVRELVLIASSAAELRGADEPSPRVWNSIEIALRQEGLIHPQRPSRTLGSFGGAWATRWLVPAAAAILIVAGVSVRQHARQAEGQNSGASAVPDTLLAGLNDDDLLLEIARTAPDKRKQYADQLRRANQYIQDAKGIVDANPNDEEARRSLLEAYQQKSMLFELAMDRSLP